MKKKNYMKMFTSYCLRYQIWFAVCTGGEIDQVTFFFDGGFDVTCEAPQNTRFGKKSGYDWLVSKRRNLIKEKYNV